ncbi:MULTISPECIES: aldo/keto reductase [Mesonia]|uniref:General stress protein 69 n=1 Tax=Mesonia oceanica TaxID=2687242 RepID=A0AC61Y903_9FLAO|nr:MULTISPECIES: aldo/keto reductase [Mesonia]MAN27543.1 alcohol dehydrogenase [Mesonia sp.]MAQ40624.1 alcohol dehydrogenase [Mesonia sp.]VVV00991.1 General stress protein 69 [Mesonia oceanica]|tara:strand:- start:7212 stop:8162 length:951 start_codon:yes stop_codon:yes gene_type:complete
MKKKKLGNTELETAPIIFGGNVFGWTLDEKESFKMLDELLDKGYDTIDTADVYSRWAEGNSGGESETILGKWMKERGVRDRISLHTKVGSDMGQGHKDISKSYILSAVEDSLKRLQTDYIDLYYTHWDDDKTPVEETLEAYQKLIDQGKVRYIGASNLSAERLQDSLDAAKAKDLPKYQVFQQQYNLMERDDFEGEIKTICTANNVGVTTYFSLASGFLTGKYRKEDDFEGKKRKSFVQKYLNRRGLEVLGVLDEISEAHQISNAGVALAWIMNRPGVTAPIASATKSSHLKAFDEAVSVNLSEQEMNRLTEVSKK